MNIEELEQCVARYWEGATTQEEERAIRSFFAENNDLPDVLEQWRGWFCGQHAISGMEPDAGFDDRVLALVELSTAQRKRQFRWLAWPSSAAAVLLAAVLIRAYVERSHVPGPAEVQQYETVKQLLYIASSGLNRAEAVLEESLEKVGVIDEYIHIE